jgi:hypothetical protein
MSAVLESLACNDLLTSLKSTLIILANDVMFSPPNFGSLNEV